jgi:hypothetical protein
MLSSKLTLELVEQVCGAGATMAPRLTGGITITTESGGMIVAAERQVLSVFGDVATVMMAARLGEQLQGAVSPDRSLKKRPAKEDGMCALPERMRVVCVGGDDLCS